MRIQNLTPDIYSKRITKLQKEMEKNSVDLFISYSNECESGSSRYLTGFWPFFDFAVVMVPVKGKAALLTGGPESYEFAESFATVPSIYINPLLVETSAPKWIPKVTEMNFRKIIAEVCRSSPVKIGIGNWNIFPHILFEELKESLPDVEFIQADDLLLNVQKIKTAVEIPYIVESYRITELAIIEAITSARPGMREWEIEAIGRCKMISLGAEGTPYPAWVCSGDNTRLSLCRSTDKSVNKNELVQLTFGAKYMGYCGNMCRPFSFGKVSESINKLMKVALEAVNYTLEKLGPGVESSTVFEGYYQLLSKYNYEDFTLYGPAHGTGSSEVEGLWLAKENNFEILPGMLFNIDVWLSDGKNGLRFEDGVLITDSGIRELTNYRREIIEL